MGTVGVDSLPVKLTTTGVNVHLGGAEPARALPEVANDPEDQDDRDGEPGHEEALSAVQLIGTRGSNSIEQLGQ